MKKTVVVFCIVTVFLFLQLIVQADAGVSDIKKRLDQENTRSVETEVSPGSTDSIPTAPEEWEIEWYFDDIMYEYTTATGDEVLRKAQAGDSRSQFLMGHWLSSTTSKNEAVEWYNKAAKQKNADALLALAKLYAKGEIVSKDLARAEEYSLIAIKWLTEAATKGDTEAQYSLGDFYRVYSGNVTDANPDAKTAAKWYEKAAEKGHPWAQIKLGHLYLIGRGVPQDVNRTTELYTKVDSKKLPHSSFYMAAFTPPPKICPRNSGDPLSEWIYTQAGKGLSWAEYLLGDAYNMNNCVPDDKTKMFEWYLKAAEHGNPDAQFALGNSYRDGTGVKTSMVEAFKWYKKASAKGYAGAKRAIESMCQDRPWACQ